MTESLEPIEPAASDSTSRALEQQVRSLQALVVATLMAGLLLSAGVNIFLFRQVSMVRKDLEASQRVVDDYEANKKQLINTFIGGLQEYGQNHPDFQAILQKYGVPPAVLVQSPQPAPVSPRVK
ncbi:MAG TPA: hypothetical protein VJW76_14700 [Verrucomicrobiae bacterium]|nr:hypothetical protein [Verrucomicrobiae bacterium]